MKKVLVIATVALFAIALYSCKGHESCPAYSKAPSKTEKIPA